MKNIIFRAWNGEQMISSFAVIGGGCFIETNSKDNDYVTVVKDGVKDSYYSDWATYKKFNYPLMQYIGIRDKINIPIFEGDIIDCRMSYSNKSLPHRGEIVWYENFGAFATKNEGGKTLLHNHCLHTIEIVGNIYENPELLHST
jgi:uncharacterized phage protein (TIGR01671 family)